MEREERLSEKEKAKKGRVYSHTYGVPSQCKHFFVPTFILWLGEILVSLHNFNILLENLQLVNFPCEQKNCFY